MRISKRGPSDRSRRRGIAVAELAVSASLLVFLVMGIIEVSRLGMASQLLTNAAREGCRVAVLPGMTMTDVSTRVNAMTASAGITVGTITAVNADPGTSGAYLIPANWDTASGDTPVTLVIRLPYTQISWVSAPMYFGSVAVTGTATLNSEHP